MYFHLLIDVSANILVVNQPLYHYVFSLLLLLLLFLTFSVLVANPKKLLYTVANPARGLLNREKRTKEKVWQHTPPPTPHTARSEKINKITRRIYRRYAGGRSRVRTRIPSARRLGLWVWLRNSTLPSAIIRFPVSYTSPVVSNCPTSAF